MKMIYVTDSLNGIKVAINTQHVVAVFKLTDGEFINKTNVKLIDGNIIVAEEDYEIVAMING